MPAWKWFFEVGRGAPRFVRIRMEADRGPRAREWILRISALRLLAALAAVALVGLAVLFVFSGSLVVERHRRHLLERRIDVLTTRVARVHSLETQLEETTLVLLKVQEMLGVREGMPDSVLADLVVRETRAGDPRALLEGRLALASQQMLHATPNAWPVRGWVTREFQGKRGPGYHPGIDIAADAGTPVRAAGDGTVLVAGWNEEYGNFVLIDHGFGLTSLYAHNSSLSVVKEDRVRAGDPIAFVGSTGHSTGPHLHFEVRRNGIPMDPKNYLLE